MRRLQSPRVLLATGILSGSVASAASAGVGMHVPSSAMQAEYQIGIDGPKWLVVVNRDGIFRTQDGGSTWMKITPPSFTSPVSYVHVFEIVAVGDRIWLEMEGADIWDVVPYSWEGGRTWHSGTFGGLGFLSDLTFTNREDGWVHLGRDNGSQSLYGTTNGGATWVVDRNADDAKRKSPVSIVGRTLPARGSTPDGLKIPSAVSAVGGLAWARAWVSNIPTYL